MLEAMRELALDFLHDKLGGKADESPEAFYNRIRATAPERLFPFLVENVEKKAKKRGGKRAKAKPEDAVGDEAHHYYTLGPAGDDPTVAILEVLDMKAGDAAKLPFNQPSGPNSPALGPVVKRTAKKGGELDSPKKVIQDRTLAYFKEVGEAAFPWSSYFADARACWARPVLRSQSETTSQKGRTAYSLALDRILEKKTVLVTFKDATGRLPGEVPEYVDYLGQQLAKAKYLPDSTIKKGMTCPLCGDAPVDVYPNALRGAGINLGNVNRAGAFPGIDASSAWKSFAPCIRCADLLYVYCKHVAGTFLTRVGGENALALPTLNVADRSRQRFVARLRVWVAEATKKVTSRERQLLKALGEDRSVNSITLVWATFRNRIDDIRGVVTEVLPSRLNELSLRNEEFDQFKLPIFPDLPLEEFDYDLSLSMLRPLFHRPGGKKAQSHNDSRRLFDLRRDLADAIYHARPLPWERFWAEIHETARWHWDAACASERPVYALLHEGRSKVGSSWFVNPASWINWLASSTTVARSEGISCQILLGVTSQSVKSCTPTSDPIRVSTRQPRRSHSSSACSTAHCFECRLQGR
jgi:CRISPR-associated protein Csh1